MYAKNIEGLTNLFKRTTTYNEVDGTVIFETDSGDEKMSIREIEPKAVIFYGLSDEIRVLRQIETKSTFKVRLANGWATINDTYVFLETDPKFSQADALLEQAKQYH